MLECGAAFAGAYVKASTAYARNTSCLRDLTQLVEVPAISPNTDLNELEQLRNMPMPGEEEIVWALEESGKPETRQALPDWIATPLVSQLLKWSHERQSWEDKIAERPNQRLTPAAQRKYDEWLEKGQVKRLLYNKGRKTLVTHESVKDLASVKKNRANLFLVTLKMSDDVSQLQVQACDGECRNLVALKGEPFSRPGLAPDFLTKAVPETELEQLQLQPEVEENEQDGELEAMLDEEKRLEDIQEEAPKVTESDLMDIMALSEDEPELQHAPKHKRVKTFMTRPAYQKLARHGLTDIPTTVPGTCLGCHATSRQWQAFFPGTHTGLSYSWGGATNRSEEEALLKTIKGLLTAFTERYPRETLWKLGMQWTPSLFLINTYLHTVYIYMSYWDYNLFDW